MTVGIWGAGLIGRSLAVVLVGQGASVHMLNRSIDKPFSVAGSSIPMRHLSFASTDQEMRACLKGLNTLVHCAGSPTDGYEEYLHSASRIASAAIAEGVKRVVMLSTVGVYGDALPGQGLIAGSVVTKTVVPLPTSPYARSRLAAEKMLHESLTAAGIECVVARISMVIGPGMPAAVFGKLKNLMAKGLFPVFGSTEASLPCIGIERLSHCLAALVTAEAKPDPLYQFSDSLSWLLVVDQYQAATGKTVRCIPLPGPIALSIATAFGIERSAAILRILMNEVRYADDSLAVLGTSLAELPNVSEALRRAQVFAAAPEGGRG